MCIHHLGVLEWVHDPNYKVKEGRWFVSMNQLLIESTINREFSNTSVKKIKR